MKLEEYIEQHLNTPFGWGSNDCITFAIGWLNVRAGKDWLAELPRWGTVFEAHTVIESIGGLSAEFDKHLKRVEPSEAKDGDIGIYGKTVYLFYGAYVLAPGTDGLVFNPRKIVSCAWSY